ncbi:mechanosensitive ion channel family protein [Alkaliflexus imshenetskii]|uniref:mechanosensitive ion channel family protein n=1 Tax=Alkaliflexus imshenetskii TaxID=286730 RepID=UPI00047D11FB|nr:mechanosensitive ion channel domain-containing protein [Alkaliflexus imshenetskii]
MESLLQNDSWLFHLSKIQYVKLVVLTILMVAIWVFMSGFHRRKSDGEDSIKQTLFVWGVRLLLLALAAGGIIVIIDMPFSSFFSTPVVVMFNQVPVSPLLAGSIVLGVYLLISTNNLLRVLVRKVSDKYGFERKIGRQMRRFLMIFVFLMIAGIWLRFAGTFLTDFFGQGLFEISNVKVTPAVLIYSALLLYGIAVALKLMEIIYNRQAKARGLSIGQSRTIFQILKYLIWLITIILLLDSIGISINMLIAGSAALLVGLGFGIQGLFNDFVSGLVLLFEGSLKVDDVVEIESGIVGKVLEVGIRTSKIRTRDNIVMIVPNNKFVNDNVINWSYNEPKTRFFVDVGVAYGSDVRMVERLLIECALECEGVINREESLVLFRDFGDSSLDFRLLFWVEDVFIAERIRSRLRFAIDAKFREHNVIIPFPQRDLHLKSGFEKQTAF